jgi:hypothetical protein
MADEENKVGTIINGDYHISIHFICNIPHLVMKLGQGTSGEVYKAEHLKTKSEVTYHETD